MRSQKNEVIQVRCVEIKLKVNKKRRQTRRDEAQELNHRERADLFCPLTDLQPFIFKFPPDVWI